MIATRPLDAVPVLPPAAFEQEWVKPRRPVVLKGLAASWPSVREWTAEGLAQAFGTVPVRVAALRDRHVVMDDRKGLLFEDLPLAEAVARVHGSAGDRYVSTPIDRLPPALRDGLGPMPFGEGAPFRRSVFWIGAAGTVSALHRDLADNVHVQLSGHKRFVLVSPRASRGVYPNGLFHGVPNGCRVDVESPDHERFPALREVLGLEATLEPGDGIYIPRWWWHHVRSMDATMSANFWWAGGLLEAAVRGADLFKRLAGMSR